MSLDSNNYVVGRGRLYFDKFPDPNTFVGSGERYLGNTPSLETTQAFTDLKHYSSESGLKIMDRAVTLQSDTTGTFTTDNIAADNLAIWYSGNTQDELQGPTTANTQAIAVQPGLWYQVGVDDNHPMGLSNLANMTAAAVVATPATIVLTFGGQPTAADTITLGGTAITFVASGATGSQVNIQSNAAGTAHALLQYINAHPSALGVTASGPSNVVTLTDNVPGTGGNSYTVAKSGTYPTFSGTTLAGGTVGSSVALTSADWTPDALNGRFSITADGAIGPGEVVTVTYDTVAGDSTIVVTSEAELFGALRFIADNPVGQNTDHFWPYVKLTSSGNYALKGDAWQEMTFSFEVLKLDNRERVYLKQHNA